MISSKNIYFIFFLLIFLDSMMSVYDKLTDCEINILTDFECLEQFPFRARHEMPKIAYLKKTINDFENDEAKKYFEHLHTFLHHKAGMLLPRDYCDDKTKSIILKDSEAREIKFIECVSSLTTTFFDSQDKTDVIKTAFWNFTEDMFSKFGTQDYRYKYYHYLCGKMTYYHTPNKKLPMTMKEFCATLHPDIDINSSVELKDSNSYKIESTKEYALQHCIDQIFNNFGITNDTQQRRARAFMPKRAFISYVGDDLKSPDAMDYYYHMYSVIKAKDDTANPIKYCDAITEVHRKQGDDKKIEEERKCVGYLLTVFLNSDATTVLKDVFLNFKGEHFAELDEQDYRFRYFYYLSGRYDFYKIKFSKYTPLTPWEFCSMDRTSAMNSQIIMESGSISGEGTSSATSRQT